MYSQMPIRSVACPDAGSAGYSGMAQVFPSEHAADRCDGPHNQKRQGPRGQVALHGERHGLGACARGATSTRQSWDVCFGSGPLGERKAPLLWRPRPASAQDQGRRLDRHGHEERNCTPIQPSRSRCVFLNGPHLRVPGWDCGLFSPALSGDTGSPNRSGADDAQADWVVEEVTDIPAPCTHSHNKFYILMKKKAKGTGFETPNSGLWKQYLSAYTTWPSF